MIGKNVSVIVLASLLISMITLASNIQLVKTEILPAPEVTVFPEHPSTDDNVNVMVGFTFATMPPSVKEFGPLIQDGNVFSVNVTIYVPAPGDIVLMVVHTDEKVYNLGKLPEGEYEFQVYVYHVHYLEGMHYLARNVSFTVAQSVLTATVDVNPHALNLRSRGKWISAYIELQESCSVDDINASTITLNDTIPAELAPTDIADYDNDTITDFMVKFNRTSVIEYILAQGTTCNNVTLTLRGKLYDNTPFEGSDIIKISNLAGDINCDNEVDPTDLDLLTKAYCSRPEETNWNPNADMDGNGVVGLSDLVIMAKHYGETYP